VTVRALALATGGTKLHSFVSNVGEPDGYLATEAEAWAFLGSPTKPVLLCWEWLEAHELPLSRTVILSEAAAHGLCQCAPRSRRISAFPLPVGLRRLLIAEQTVGSPVSNYP
jgi:hypothetical protein